MGKDKPVISVAIVSMNGEKWIKKLLESIMDALVFINTDRWEILLIDNASSDMSPDIFRLQFEGDSRGKLIRNEKNIGWSPAVNQAFELSQGDFIFILSNDMEIHENSIKCIINLFEKDSKIGIVQFNSISIYDKITQDSGRNYIDRFGFLYGYKASEFPEYVGVSEGMAFAVSRDLLVAGVKMDDTFFMMYDDADFSYRARMMAFKVVFDPNSIVYHYRGGTVGNNAKVINPLLARNGTRNHLTFILKCYELKNVLITFPIAFFVLFTESILFLRIDHAKFKTNIRALFEVFLRLKETINQRREVQNSRKVSDYELLMLTHKFRPGSIIKNSSFMSNEYKGKVVNDERVDLIGKIDVHV